MIVFLMPRKARIDAPGALHHIIIRGIERRKIFLCDADRDFFLERFGRIIKETHTSCFAWALMDNHAHFLIRTGLTPIPTVMRRLLTGHAVSFNRRHHRNGHLFQNRYKSILCQEDPYLLELVRYIHLNPLRSNLATDYSELARYPYSGHSFLLGKCHNEWQDTSYVLLLFDRKKPKARFLYGEFVKKGMRGGRRA